MSTSTRVNLNRASIVDTAVELLAVQGEHALTMRRLGEALGVDPTAVYRHFRDKSELMRAVGDRLLNDVTIGIDVHQDWRAIVVAVCSRLRSALLRQPQLAATVRDAPPLEAGEFAITETLLQQFLRADLAPGDAALAYHSVIELTVGSATIDATLDALDETHRELRYDRWRSAYAALPADQYPASQSVAEHLYRGTASDRFTIAIERLLDGIVPPPTA